MLHLIELDGMASKRTTQCRTQFLGRSVAETGVCQSSWPFLAAVAIGIC